MFIGGSTEADMHTQIKEGGGRAANSDPATDTKTNKWI